MKNLIFFSIALLFLQSCIGDDIVMDFVEPTVRINNPLDTIEIDSSFQFQATYLNNVGSEEEVNLEWTSDATNIISIDNNGLASALETGSASITVAYNGSDNPVSETIVVNVGERTVVASNDKGGTIEASSFYQLEGDFTITDNGSGGVDIVFADNYAASSSLPGLYVYLTNNPNTTAGATEIGKVTVFQGAHTYTVENVGVSDFSHLLYFCKPFNVKVGDGEIE